MLSGHLTIHVFPFFLFVKLMQDLTVGNIVQRPQFQVLWPLYPQISSGVIQFERLVTLALRRDGVNSGT